MYSYGEDFDNNTDISKMMMEYINGIRQRKIDNDKLTCLEYIGMYIAENEKTDEVYGKVVLSTRYGYEKKFI